jgi:DNA-binding winged helix-turn-helix (wHTH) protein
MTSESGVAPELTPTNQPGVSFDEFRLDFRLRTLYRGSEKVKLTPKPLATLEFLIQNRQRVVSKTELLTNIWGGQREMSTVEHAIGQLRRALGDNAEQGRYIETVPGQGYRFVAEILPEKPTAPVETPRPNTIQTARWLRRPLALALALVCLVGIGAVLVYLNIPRRVARATWNGNTLVAMSDSGQVLWRYPFDEPLRELPPGESLWRTQIVDLDGDGVPEVLVAASFASPGGERREELFCFSSGGKLLWRYKPPKDEIEFNSHRDQNGPWKFSHMLVVPDGHSSSIWVAVVHDVWWASFVVRLSSAGAPTRMFTSSGNVMNLRRVQTKAGTYILAAGVNNEYSQASLAILAENGPPSTSPQSKGSEFECIRGCTSALPYRYIRFPRSEVNQAGDMPYNIANWITARSEGFSVDTDESQAMMGLYDFSRDLQPERVAYGSGYRGVHERFEREGLINHSYHDCPEWKSPAILRICDEHGNWDTVSVPRVPSHE